MPSTNTWASALLLAGVAAANPFTTLDVCPGADPSVAACTVTAQHQKISTCSPVTSTCSTGPAPTITGKLGNSTAPFESCSTSYSYSTWAWVSSVIPCAWDGKTISSCTVTKTDQIVPCSKSVTTSSSVTPTKTGYITYTTTATGVPHTTGISVKTTTEYSTSYQTVSKVWNAAYNNLGPNAIPGYDGNDLFDGDSDDGSNQKYDVTECVSSDGQAAKCNQYPENRFSSKSGSKTSTPVTATNSIKTSVSSSGTYTFSFTNSAPAQTISSGGQQYTQPPQPWFNYETRTANGPTNFDFVVTVTKTVFAYAPPSTSTGSNKPVDPTNNAAWGPWNAPSQPTPGSSDPSTGSSGWGNWNNGAGSGSDSSDPSSGSSGWGNWNNGGQSNSGSGSSGAPGGGSFYIPVDTSGSKYSKGDQWVGFPNGGDDGSVVSGKGNAAQFYWDSDGNLMYNGQYVSTSTNAGYLVFELGPNKPSGPKFGWNPDGSFGLPGAGFCSTGSTLFITFGSSPGGCKPVTCNYPGKS